MLDQVHTEPVAFIVRPLDKLGLAALQQADRIVFSLRDGTSSVRAIKEMKPDENQPFADKERDLLILADTFLVDYDRENTGLGSHVPKDELADYVAFEMEHTTQSAQSTWQTIAHSLQPGDLLTLYWARSGKSTQAVREGKMFSDALYLEVVRLGKKKNKGYRWLVDVSTGPDNTARMIRRIR